MYSAISIVPNEPVDTIPTIPKNGSADIIAPPGAPGAATIAIPKVIINGNMVDKLWGILFIIKTAVTQLVIVIILPAIWIVAQSGTTKSLISSETPLFLAHSTFTGIVAAEDWVPSAVIYPGIWCFNNWSGFFFPIAPEIINKIIKSIIKRK